MVESASLPVGDFAKFQPHSKDFVDLTNPKAVLESKLRNFACLSTGDVIAIVYNNKVIRISLQYLKNNLVDRIFCLGRFVFLIYLVGNLMQNLKVRELFGSLDFQTLLVLGPLQKLLLPLKFGGSVPLFKLLPTPLIYMSPLLQITHYNLRELYTRNHLE